MELMVIEVEMRSSANPSKQRLHVGQRGDRNSDAAYFAGGQWMVGIQPHLGRKIERDGKSRDALREQVLVAAIAFLGGAEAGVLPHGPQAAAIHVRVNAARDKGTRRVYPDDRS